MTEVYAATLGATPHTTNKRSVPSFQRKIVLATFNTPASSWDTIVIPKVIGGLVGDTIKLSVFKGSIPDDLGTPDDNGETTRRLSQGDYLASSTYVVTGSDIPLAGMSIQFDFNVSFSSANCGATYTVAMEQFDSSNNRVSTSFVFCTDRGGVDNFINPNDYGYESGNSSTAASNGGAGNSYIMSLPSASQTIYDISATPLPHSITQGGVRVYDACPPWGTYSREVVTLNSTAYGATRALTAPLTNSLTAGLT